MSPYEQSVFADAVDVVQAVDLTFNALIKKAQDMVEVGVTMNAWEYRMKWLGEDEQIARRQAYEIGVPSGSADSFLPVVRFD